MTRNKPFIDSDTEQRDLQIYTENEEPKPGSTERTKTIKKIGRPRKPLDTDGLRTAEAELKQKYPQVVEGTLINATKGAPTNGLTDDEVHKYNHKRSIIINCPCGAARRIATSDLAQVTLCEDCTREARNQRKRDRRAEAATQRANSQKPA